MKHPINKIIVFLIILIIIFIIGKYYNFNEYLSIKGFNNHHDQLVSYEQQNPLMFIASYIASYILLISCCIPGTILLDLLAGYIFGNIWGSILVISSYSTGALINFLIVRYFFKNLLYNRFAKFKKLIHGRGKYGLFLNLTGLRLIPVIPFWVLNIVAALVGVKISTFFLSTLIGIIPTSIIYVIIGDGLRDNIDSSTPLSTNMFLDPKIWLPLVCLGLLVLLPNLLHHIKKRTQQSKSINA